MSMLKTQSSFNRTQTLTPTAGSNQDANTSTSTKLSPLSTGSVDTQLSQLLELHKGQPLTDTIVQTLISYITKHYLAGTTKLEITLTQGPGPTSNS